MLENLVEAAKSALQAISVCVVLKPYQEGVIFRLGKKRRTIGQGLHWLIPLIDECDKDITVARTVNLHDQSLTTLDSKTVTVSAVVTARIRNIEKALCEVEDFDIALADACYAAIGALVIASPWEEIRAPGFKDRLKKACQERAGDFGAWVERINFDNLVECPVVRVLGVSPSKPALQG